MTKRLLRVPMDFNAPLGVTWSGYVNPHFAPCPAAGRTCFGGSTGAGAWLDAWVGFLMVLGEESSGVTDVPSFTERQKGSAKVGRIYPHPYLQAFTHPSYEAEGLPAMVPPTEELAALTERLAGRGPRAGGHDGIDRVCAVRAVRRALKLPATWGVCPVCAGHAQDPATRATAKAWRPTKPPRGKGYQLWDDDAPRSPVFASLDELATWCETNATTFGNERATREAWARMLRDGFVHHAEDGALFL